MARKKNTHIPSKAMCLSIGQMSDNKMSDIFSIREKYCQVSREFVDIAFQEDFLFLDDYSPKIITQNYTLPYQKTIQKGFLNKTYIEKARRSVEASLWEQYVRSIRFLCQAIHQIDKEAFWKGIDLRRFKKNGEIVPKFKYVPVELQDLITNDELSQIKVEFSKIKEKQRLDWLKEVIVNGDKKSFNNNQINVIKHSYEVVKNRFSKPKYGVNEDFSTTIHLDYRVVKDYKQKIVDINNHTRMLIDNDNAKYRLFLELSHPTQHGKKIKIPLQLNKKQLEKLVDDGENPSSQSFLLVIHHDKIEVRTLFQKDEISTSLQEKYEQIKQADHLLGRDFGYCDTITLSVIKNEFNLDFQEFEKRLSLKKDETKSFYQNHKYTPQVIEQVQFSGQNFMKKLAQCGLKIDKYKGNIDHIYNKIDAILINLKNHFNLKEDDLICEDYFSKDDFVNRLIQKFFKLLDEVNRLKTLRRNQYKKVQGIKKSWFGYLSNVEKSLIKKYKAAPIVEDLTVMAAEKEMPEYKGSSFNKMINNGSKGQYMRMAKEKFLWNGILEIRIPSFYSSKTCIEHSIVEENPRTMRKNKVFTCPKCKIVKDADKNASDTIASFLLLRPA